MKRVLTTYKVVVGGWESQEIAERFVKALRKSGIPDSISIIVQPQTVHQAQETKAPDRRRGDERVARVIVEDA